MSRMDEIFKRGLNDHESSVRDDIWNEISANIENTEKPVPVSFGWVKVVSVFSLVLIASAGYFIIPNLSRSNLITDSEMSGKDYKTIKQDIEKPLAIESSPQISTESIKLEKSVTQAQAAVSAQDYNTSSKNTTRKTDINDTKNATSLTQSQSTVTQSNPFNDNQISDVESGQTLLNTGQLDNSNTGNLFGTLLLDKERDNDYAPIDSRNLSDEELFTINNSTALLDIPVFAIKKRPQACPSFYKNIWVPYMWLEYGSILPQRNLQSVNGNEDYIAMRESSESTQYSWDVGAGFGIKSPSGVYGELGVQYSQIQEQFSFTDPETIKRSQVITFDTLIVDGQMITSSDTSYVDIPGAITILTNNRYKFFNFPFMLGYEYNLSQNVALGIKAGVILNFSARQRGRFINENEEPVWFSSNVPNRYEAFEQKIGASYMVGATATYHVGDLISLYASPQLKMIPNSITLDSYSLRQTYLNPSLTLGLKYSIL